jgi:GNAT superfamily N-acetyltransferase
MTTGIIEIDFDIIKEIWKDKLWPGRKSPIETHSAMLYSSKEYDTGNFLLPAYYHGYYVNNKLIGVNSCHLCVDKSIRSRGLWVDEMYRKNGYGKRLLEASIGMARAHKGSAIWSFPRKSSWPTYKSAGFALTSDWKQTETSEANAYCYLGLN